MRKVFLEDLNYQNETRIDWSKNIGNKIHYTTSDEHGYFEILGYKNGKLNLKDDKGYLYSNISTPTLKQGSIPARFHKANSYTIHNIKKWCQLNQKQFELLSEKYSGKNNDLEWKCINCNEIVIRSWHSIRYHSTGCYLCSDTFSYGEKFVSNLLTQLNVKYKREYSPEWANKKRYDFYLYNENIIIETHGLQHYEEWSLGRDLNYEQTNDKLKEKLAEENKVNKYITIDIRRTDFNYLKNSILKSKLSEIFDLTCIDWIECNKVASSSVMTTTWEIWNSGMRNTGEICTKLNIDRVTVIKYLKKGKELGICDYDPKEQKPGKNKNSRKKPIVQLTINGDLIEHFESLSIASSKLNLYSNGIHNSCKLKKTYKGFKWMYKEDYDKLIG